MSLTPTTFLGLVLCLGPEIQAHNGSLPRPSISAEPGSMIRWGMPVTFVCQSPHGAEAFRLEKSKSNSYQDVKLSSGTEKEARFLINSVTTDTAGRYNCLYFTGNTYSERSEFLELVVTGDHGSFSPSPTVLHSSPVEWQSSQPGETLLKVLALSHRAIKGKSLNSALEARSRMSEFNASLHHPLVDTTRPQILSPELLYSLIGISVAFLLCLLLLVLFFIHRQCQRKHRIPRSKGKEQNPQERLSPGVDILNSTPDMARVDGLPENDREMDTSPLPHHLHSLSNASAASSSPSSSRRRRGVNEEISVPGQVQSRLPAQIYPS
ncbi:leukocyte-associated immunoglobulin-like receptor 1 isoform X1 [Loxodonta africana]|uniref:leukocyte-associated immunoglobulin-like receptor 1 isoform X1 n=1 Tax=Loxodonta africana TaxID=9785 RepID=UPI0030D603CC